MNQKLIKLNNFLFSVRKGFLSYLLSWLASIGVFNVVFQFNLIMLGLYPHLIYSIAVAWIFMDGLRQGGMLSEWDKKEYWNKL